MANDQRTELSPTVGLHGTDCNGWPKTGKIILVELLDVVHKHGFGDGDMLADWYYDLAESLGIDFDAVEYEDMPQPEDLLHAVVNSEVMPHVRKFLPDAVLHASPCSFAHNGARLENYSEADMATLEGHWVEIPWEAVEREARRLFNLPDDAKMPRRRRIVAECWRAGA